MIPMNRLRGESREAYCDVLGALFEGAVLHPLVRRDDDGLSGADLVLGVLGSDSENAIHNDGVFVELGGLSRHPFGGASL